MKTFNPKPPAKDDGYLIIREHTIISKVIKNEHVEILNQATKLMVKQQHVKQQHCFE